MYARLQPSKVDHPMSTPSRARPKVNLVRIGLLGIFFGILALGAGLRSVGRTAVDEALLYTGGVLLPLGVAVLLAGVIEASRRKHEQIRGGFEVVGGPPPTAQS